MNQIKVEEISIVTTEEFVRLRVVQLHGFFRAMWGPHWRSILAKRMGRWDAPRFLVAAPGKHPVSLKMLIPVEKIAAAAGLPMGRPRFTYYQFRCPDDAPERWYPNSPPRKQ